MKIEIDTEECSLVIDGEKLSLIDLTLEEYTTELGMDYNSIRLNFSFIIDENT